LRADRAVLAGLWLTASATVAADGLEPGQFRHTPELVDSNALVAIVSLPRQRLHLYRGGVRIAISTVTTGGPGYETPPGAYTILQKRREHYSNLYDDAPMPFMQRLTWDGVALHGGVIRATPSSHGCVRLPEDFAARLYELTTFDTRVLITDGVTPVPGLVEPGFLAPVNAQGDPLAAVVVGPGEFQWLPERSPEGPVLVVASSRDTTVAVLRGGIEIGRARMAAVPGLRFGLQAFELRAVADDPLPHWHGVELTGVAAVEATGALELPHAFMSTLVDSLEPGARLILTDEALDAVDAGPFEPGDLPAEPPCDG
jgi:hypothetical protein